MVAKLILVVCVQAVIMQSISAQAYGIFPGITSSGCGCSGTLPTIAVSNCGCSNSAPIAVSNCGCSNSAPIAVSNCGCSNSVPIAASNCGCSNTAPIAFSNCDCSNSAPIAVSNCGCSNSAPIAVTNCGCTNSAQAISVPNANFGYSKTTTASTGGPLSVTCYGPLSTNGVSVLAELGINGELEVTGSMPFLSAVVLEGTLPTTGVAAVNYGCGDGEIVILQENGNPSGRNAASSSGLSLASVGAGSCGCRY